MIIVVVPKEIDVNLLDLQKIARTALFGRKGGTRRQDHGTRGNTPKNKEFRQPEIGRRRTLRRGGLGF